MNIKERYKRVMCCILAAVMIAGIVPQGVSEAQEDKRPSVQASAYVVTDAKSGETLFRKKADKKIYPASTVKLMTALVTLDKLKLNKKITMTNKIKKLLPWDAAALSLKCGAKYTVEQYLNMMLIASDAGSAAALAVGTSGSFKKFSTLMNKKAKKLGMENSSFDNPIGLDIGNGYKHTYTTASDFSKLAVAAMNNKVIKGIVKKAKYKVPKVNGSKSFTIQNTNKFYGTYKLKNSDYKIIGTKTGSTNAAGRVLIATAKDSEGHEVIVSYFGAKTADNLYTGIKKLFDYTFSRYKKGKISLS